MTAQCYIDQITLGRQLTRALRRYGQSVSERMESERNFLSQDVKSKTQNTPSFEILGPDHAPLKGSYTVEMDISNLDIADNKLVLTLRDQSGKRLDRLSCDLEREYLGTAGMRVQALRVWSSLSRYTETMRGTASLKMHEAFDSARADWHTYFEEMLEQDFKNWEEHRFATPKELCRHIASGFLIFTPFLYSQIRGEPIMNPWLANMSHDF